MKKILFTLFTLSFCLQVFAQSNGGSPALKPVYYYYKNQKIYFSLSQDHIVIGFAEGASVNSIQPSLRSNLNINPDSLKHTAVKNQYILKLKNNEKATDILSITSTLKTTETVLYARPCIVGMNGKLSSYGNEFIVKLKAGTSLKKLTDLIQKTNCRLIRKYLFNDSTFIIGAEKANEYDALTTANLFFETGLFEYAEPDIELYDAIDDIPNDPLYYLQWSHKNTGSAAQYNGVAGADMNVDSAWLITKGKSNITIAVVDVGVDIAHPDLKQNMLQGFNCITLTSNKNDGEPLGTGNAHGTCVAGIIAAAANNSVGVAGVAPGCKLIPVNLADSNGNFTTESNIAAGIDYAWMHGADVITNSWGGGTPSSIIDDVIHRAVTQGRSGKGCTVLFSSGNNNAGLSYPAINNEVVAVGGINMCNQRKDPNSCDGENWWGASYGSGLAIAAPCVKIATTDLSGTNGYSAGNYFKTFNGTSAACPHVAAVAAMILSVNPQLSQDNVKTIIENTADKIPGYVFKMTSGYKNGTWNNELGYGRVDAYHAVIAAQNGMFCNAEIEALSQVRFCNGDSVHLAVINADGTAAYKWYQDNTLIQSGAVSITAKKSASYKIIATYSNGCTATSPSISVTAVTVKTPLIANAGSNVSLCSGSTGARIGGIPSAAGGAAFLNKKRAYSMDWYTNNFYRYNLKDPTDVDTVLKNVTADSDFRAGNFFTAGDFTPLGYYALTRSTDRLIRIDTLNGDQQIVKIIHPNSGNWQGLAWDASLNRLYAMSSFGNESELYTIDLVTGALTFIAEINLNYLVWIAIDNNGNMYALSNDTKYIYQVNKQTGAATALPQIGDNGFNFAQDADFDPITDSLYLSAFSARQDFVGDLRIANTTTGTVSSIGTIGTTPYNEMDATGIAGYTYTYSWSPAAGLSDALDANPMANPAKTTTYTLTVADICNNQATAQVTVTPNTKPSVKIKSSVSSLCAGKVHLSATHGNAYTYQWYFNDSVIVNATDSFYEASAAGAYTVKVIAKASGCDSLSNPFKVTACSKAAIVMDGIKNSPGYHLYPNPATSNIIVSLPATMQPSVMYVYDMNGKIILYKKYTANQAHEQLGIAGLTAGMYRVVWQQNKRQLTWKFVKQ